MLDEIAREGGRRMLVEALKAHRCSDGTFLAYAQWPDQATWERSSSVPLPENQAMAELKDAIASSKVPVQVPLRQERLGSIGFASDHAGRYTGTMRKFETAIRCKTLVRTSRTKLYEVLSTASGWDAWFTTGTEFELDPHGKILFRWKNWGADKVSLEARATVAAFERDSFIQFLWNYGLEGGPTSVELKLSSRGADTLLEICESGYPDTLAGHAMFNECATGWGEAMTLLKVYLEHGITFK